MQFETVIQCVVESVMMTAGILAAALITLAVGL